MKTKRGVSFSISEALMDDFIILAKVKKVIMSDIVETLIRDYVIKNKAELNEYMLKYWNNEISN